MPREFVVRQSISIKIAVFALPECPPHCAAGGGGGIGGGGGGGGGWHGGGGGGVEGTKA